MDHINEIILIKPTKDISVERSNLPSVKTILNHGGVYQRSFVVDSEMADVYHIKL